MPQTVEIPGKGTVEFPDNMTPDQMSAAIKKSFPDLAPKKETAPKKEGDFGGGITDPLNRGIADVLGIVGNTGVNIENLGKAAYGRVAGAMGASPKDLPEMTNPADVFGTSEYIQNAMTKAGILNPANQAESGVGRVGQAGLRAIPQILTGGEGSAAQKLAQAGGAAVSGASSQTAQEMGLGPAAQITAGMLPGAVHQGATAGIDAARKNIVGSTDIPAQQKAFQGAGVTNPTAGMVTGSPTLQKLESISSKTPGGATKFENESNKRVGQLESKVGGLTQKLSPGGTSPAVGGKAIEHGMGAFKARSEARQEQLENEAFAHVTPNDPVKVTNFQNALNDLTKTKPGEENVLSKMTPSEALEWKSLLEKDLGARTQQSPVLGPNGKPITTSTPAKDTLSYETLKDIRTRIGQAAFKDTSLFPSVPRDDLIKLYDSLSKDLDGAFRAKGGEAAKAWEKRNQHYAAYKNRTEALSKVVNKDDPEQVFSAAVSGTKEGATRLNRVLNSLPVKDRQTVAGVFIDRLGRTTPDAPFSLDKFVTDWGKIHGNAKKALLQGQSAKDMDTIVSAAQKIKDSGNVLSNKSGTAKTSAYIAGGSVGTLVLERVMQGKPGEAAAIAGSAAASMGANAAFASAMHDPKFINWLAKGAKVPLDQRQQYATRLYQLAKNTKDPDQQDAEQAIALTLGAKGE